MKKLTIIYIMVVICALQMSAQQTPSYSLFMTNPFLTNPALAGTHNYYQIISNHRFQWVGLNDAPVTNVISMYGPMVNHPMGLGGYIMYDVFGPTSNLSLNGTYAYNYAINEQLKISSGISIGINQFVIDESKLETEDFDPIITGTYLKFLAPEATIGFYLYSSTYHIGFSASQLIPSKFNKEVNTEGITEEYNRSSFSKLNSHFYLTGGYKYYINREWAVEPTIIIKKVVPAPYQLDFNVRTFYRKRQWDKNSIWGGIAYRTQDAFTILVGFIYEKKVQIGYSYDIGLNRLSVYNAGSHELMLGFLFNPIKDYR